MLRNNLLLLFVLTLFIGCQEDDNPVSPTLPSYTVTIDGLPDQLTAPNGVTRELPLTITVTDAHTAQAVAGVEVALSASAGEFTTATSTTDAHGKLEATYSVQIPEGETSVRISALAESFVARESLIIIGTAPPAMLILTADSVRVYRREGVNATVELTAQVLDSSGVGIPHSRIRFSRAPADEFTQPFGSLRPVSHTDENGIAMTTFNSLGEFGSLIIRCELDEGPAMDVSDEITIDVISLGGGRPEGGILYLLVDREYIYADNGVTSANVTAVVKSEENQAVPDAVIRFSADNNGAITSAAVTDSLGVARATFTDIGLPSMDAEGNRAPSTITARCDEFRLEATAQIDIRPLENVDNIVLTAGADNMWAGSGDSTWVRAKCYLDEARTQFAPQGTMVHFEDDGMGAFTQREVAVGDAGIAQTNFVVGDDLGTAVLRAKVYNPDEGENPVVSNEVTIELIAGPPAHMSVWIDPTVLNIGDPNAQATITATVTDAYDNPVQDGSVLVHFTSTLGTVDPPTAPTENGIAVSYLRPGREAGVCNVTVTIQTPEGPIYGQGIVQFVAGEVSSIELRADPLEIPAVDGISTIQALCRDGSGNLVELPTPVVLELVTAREPPEAPRINGQFPSDTVLTSNGVARFTLTAGTRTGPLLIRAYTLDADGNPSGVQASISTLAIVAGTPAAIALSVNTDAEDVGGGVWGLEVAARVYDLYRNPARDDIPVLFTVLEEESATISPGRTRNGVALTTLAYNSSNTFDTVTVHARILIDEGDSIWTDLEFVLPLQRGELTIYIDPENWMIDDDPDLIVHVWAVLIDGHGVLINNAPILFSASRGQFYYVSRTAPRVEYTPFYPNPAIRHTGPHNDGANAAEREADNEGRGMAAVFMLGDMDDFFLDPFTLEVTVQIEAQVVGYDEVFTRPVFLVVTRHG